MKHKKQRKNSGKNMAMKIGACLTVTALVVTLFQSYGTLDSSAEDYLSLSGIEEIKGSLSAENPYNILEVVPEEYTGSIGYYIPGEEPFDWKGQIATLPTKEARKSHMTNLLNELETKGLLSSGGTTPLEKNAADYIYEEYYPWESEGKTNIEEVNFSEKKEEELDIAFNLMGAGNGEFKLTEATYALVSEDMTGNYKQIIEEVSRENEGPYEISGYYYYDMKFSQQLWISGEMPTGGYWGDGTETTEPSIEVPLANKSEQEIVDLLGGRLIFTKVTPADGGESYNEFYGKFPETIEELIENPFELHLNQAYYIGETNTRPQTTYSESNPYGVLGEGFEEIDVAKGETGYFEAIDEKYEYVGAGNGSYGYESSATEKNTVVYGSLYINPGFTNNNWFRAGVFDESDDTLIPELPIEVDSVTPENVTLDLIEAADLILITNGYNSTKSYGTGNDLDESIVMAIKAKAIEASDVATPIYVENTISLGTNIVGLVNDVKEQIGNKEEGAINSFLVLESTELVSADFEERFPDSQYKEEDTPFNQVYEEIVDDNFLRDISGAEKLPEVVSVATSLRHIINYPHRRTENKKENIHVLEIQPVQDGSKGTTAEELTKEKVQNWLPEGEFTDEQIHITTMAITEFIGKIEDINEVYDLVYIGDSTEGMRVSSGSPNYEDSKMDGMYYTNIGDTVNYVHSKTAGNILGLLDREYITTGERVTATLFNGVSTSVYPIDSNLKNYIARFSGWDLSESKYKELIDFANAGFPIIVGDKLVSEGTAEIEEAAVEVEIDAVVDADNTVTMGIKGLDEREYIPHKLSYQWFEEGAQIDGATSKNYTTRQEGTYYCEVTLTPYTEDTEVSTVKSNDIHVSEGALVVNETNPSSYPAEYTGNNHFGTVRTVDTLDEIKTGAEYSMTAELNFELPPEYEVKSIKWYTGSGSNYTEVTTANIKNNFSNGEIVTDLNSGVSTLKGTLSTQGAIGVMCVFSVGEEASTGVTHSFVSMRRGVERKATIVLPCGPYYAGGAWIEGWSGGNTSHYTMSVAVDSSITGDNIELKAVPKLSPYTENIKPDMTSMESTLYKYQWYGKKDGAYEMITGAVGATYQLSTDTYESYEDYLCLVTAGEKESEYTEYNTATPIGIVANMSTKAIKLEKAFGATVDGNVGTLTIPAATKENSISANSAQVDNSSYMYQMINEARWHDNVMSNSSAIANKVDVLQYLNLSKPEVVFQTSEGEEQKPQEYKSLEQVKKSGGGTTSLIEDGILRYEFVIENATDPTVLTTTYEAKLYVDQNSDGKHEVSELISDLQVYESEGDGKKGERVSSRDLIADKVYIVERQLPNTFYGAIPWKLEVVKTTDSTVHNSETGITYVAPEEPVEIKLLQIAGSSGGKAEVLPDKYMEYFDELREVGIYDIKYDPDSTEFDSVMTITELNTLSEQGADAVYNKLDEYDMILMGFQESYGQSDSEDGFNRIVSEQVNRFIDSGKATLYTHDNVSNENVPIERYPDSSGSTIISNIWSYSGYYLTLLNRGGSGQDPYGIVSEKYGFSQNAYIADANTNGTHYIASGYSGVDDVIEEQIKDAGYGIAYEPGSDRGSYVHETQAYNNYSLMAHRAASYGKAQTDDIYVRNGTFATTSDVSQVNKGAITTYPYDVNVGEFYTEGNVVNGTGKTTETLEVGSTHHQWYQLNMSTEDIVVWYCLTDDGTSSGDTYSHGYNDVMNGYYIYTLGNVTYTGAGHLGNDNPPDSEVKLFVNTIIASYRVSLVEPEVEFTDKNGRAITSHYLPAELSDEAGTDFDQVLMSANEDFAGRVLDFQLEDINLDANKQVSVNLYYEDPSFEVGESYYEVDGEMVMAKEEQNNDGIMLYRKVTQEEMKLKDESGKLVPTGDSLQSGTVYAYSMSDEMISIVSGLGEMELRLEVVTTIPDEEPLKGLSNPLNVLVLGLQELN